MLRYWVAIVALGVVPATAAYSQTPTEKPDTAKAKKTRPARSVPRARKSPFDLLDHLAVRAELKLTPDQEKRIKESRGKLDRYNEESRKAFKDLEPEPDPQARAELIQRDRDALPILENEAERNALKALDPKQRTRLNQIGIQIEGIAAFLLPNIQEALNMDPAQAEMIREIYLQERQETDQVRKTPMEPTGVAMPPSPNPGESRGKLDDKALEQLKSAMVKKIDAEYKIRDSMKRRVAKVLRKKQLQAYQALCGEPFDFVAMRKGELIVHPKPKQESP